MTRPAAHATTSQCLRALVYGTLVLGFLSTASALASPPADLAVALARALERPLPALADVPASPDEGAGWLAGSPTLSASYLASQESWGTDETEFSVNLPVQSPRQRRLFTDLVGLDPELDAANAAFRRWQLSGLLRDLYARYRLNAGALNLALAEQGEISALEARAQEQQRAGSLEPFELWVINRTRREISANVARLEAGQAALIRQFNSLTGFDDFPETAGEPDTLPPEPLYDTHPQALLARLEQARELQAARAGSPQLQPWNVGIIGRELAVADRAEWQIGMAVSIPLDVGGAPPTTVRSAERALYRQYALARDNWLLALRERWEQLQAERETLLAEQRLLSDPMEAEALRRSLATLERSTELPIEQRVERRLALLRVQARPDLLERELEANAARLRQLAGLSL